MAVELVCKQVTARTVADDELEIVASDESIDRMGDVVRVDGWELGEYRKNPIVLWQHQSWEPPIGRAEKVWKYGKQLLARLQLAPEGTSPLVDNIRKLVAGDFIRAASVGFRKTKPVLERKDKEGKFIGYEFVGQELLEISLVNVPAQPAALRKALALGFSPADLGRLFAPDAPVFLAQRRAEIDLIRARARALVVERP